jgi:hypothetical protein
MRFEIGQSGADIAVLLKTLRGNHARSRSSIITSWVLGLVGIWVVPILVRLTIDARTSNDRLFGGTMVVVGAAFAIGMLLESLTIYRVTDEGITKKHPLGLFSWTIPRGDIHEVALELERGWRLRVTTTFSRKHVLSVEGSLRKALAVLYPEVAPFEPTPQDIRRWKWLAAVLGLVVLAVVAMLGLLVRQGLVSWR